MEKWIPTAIVSFATAAALLGNLSALVVLKFRWRSSGATKMYIMTLAALDLVCVLVSVPRELLTLDDRNSSTGSLSDCQRQTDDTAVGTTSSTTMALCKVGMFFTYQMTFTTALILVAISTNRLVKITGVGGEARSVLTARGAGAGGGKARRSKVKSLVAARRSLLTTVELIGKERGAKAVCWVAGIVSLAITIPVVFAYGGRSDSTPNTTTNTTTNNNTATPNVQACVSPCLPCYETTARSLHAFYLIVFLAAGAVSLTLYGAALRLLCKDCCSGDEAEAQTEAVLVPWRRGYRRYRNECGGGGGRSRLSAVVYSHRVSCSLGTLCEARESSDLAAGEGKRPQVLRSKSEGDDAAFVAAAAAAAVPCQEPCRRRLRADATTVVDADAGADAPGRASLTRTSSTGTSATSTASTASSEASSAPPKSPVGSEPTAAAACPPTSTVATRAAASSSSSHSIFRSFSWNLFAGLGSLNPRQAEPPKSASFRVVSGRPFSAAVSKPLGTGPCRERRAETCKLRPITTAPFYADDKGDDDNDSGDSSDDDGDDVYVDASGGQPDEKEEKEEEDDVGELVATAIEWLSSISAEPNVEFHPPVTARCFPGSAAAVASSTASAPSAVSATGAEAAVSTASTSSSSSPSASCVVHDAATVSEPVVCPVDYIADARASVAADATDSTPASTNGDVADATVSTPASTNGDVTDTTVSTPASTNGDVTDAAANPISTAILDTAAVPTATGSASLSRSVYRRSLLLPPVSYSAELMSVMNLHSDRTTNSSSLSRQDEFMRRQASVSSVQFSRLGSGISKQSTIVFFLATLVYFVTYLPFFAIMYKEAASRSSRREPAEDVLARLYLISHAAKPVVYFVFNSHFRSSLWKLIVCRREIL